MDILAGVASTLLGKYFKGDQGWPQSLLHGLGGSLTNLGYPIGMAIAKFMGFGFLGQVIGGGLGAMAGSLVFGPDEKRMSREEEERKRRMVDYVSNRKESAMVNEAVDRIVEQTGKSREEVWNSIFEQLSKS